MTSLSEWAEKTRPVKVSQVTGSPSAKSLASLDHLLIVLPEKVSAATWRKLPQGNKLKDLMRRRAPGQVPAVRSRLGNKRQTAVCVGTVSAGASTFEALTFARKMVASTGGEKAGSIGILVSGFATDDAELLARHVLAAALAAAYVMPAYREKASPPRIRQVRVLGLPDRIDDSRIVAEAEGNNLVRLLTALPANKLDAEGYATLLKKMAGDEGWQFKKYGVQALRKMGAGAFCAVAQGNADDSASIIRLRYRPGLKNAAPAISLVGKGIIFDTGGTNLKPFNSMLDMHIDMGGSAVAVGALLTMTRLGLDAPVDCWLAITENRTGPTAYKSQDVVTALNGKTIQTIHTDAEGRMALADTLVLAEKEKPAIIIDYATLTGACINAVTTRYSGVFTNRPALHPVLRKAGEASGERVWPFPIGKEYLEDLKSDTADIMQCSPGGGGDHILAGSFLNEFVTKSTPWIHVDLSACKRKGGLAHVPSELTGFGIRFTTQLVIDSDVANRDI